MENFKKLPFSFFFFFFLQSFLSGLSEKTQEAVLSVKAVASHPHPPTHTQTHTPLILPLCLLCVRQMRQWDNNGAQRHMSES